MRDELDPALRERRREMVSLVLVSKEDLRGGRLCSGAPLLDTFDVLRGEEIVPQGEDF